MEHKSSMSMGWARFAGMIATSTVIMFFLMYHFVFQWEHALFSLTRLLSALIMGCIMTAIMLVFMWDMYRPDRVKIGVLVTSLGLALVLLGVNRSQALVDDTAFLKAMIPHHSIAINNARKAHLSDPRVRRLANYIISSQVREIEEMKILTSDIARNGPRGSATLAPVPAAITPDMASDIANAVR